VIMIHHDSFRFVFWLCFFSRERRSQKFSTSFRIASRSFRVAPGHHVSSQCHPMKPVTICQVYSSISNAAIVPDWHLLCDQEICYMVRKGSGNLQMKNTAVFQFLAGISKEFPILQFVASKSCFEGSRTQCPHL